MTTWNAITQEIYKLDGSADPENKKSAVIHYCSPRGMGTEGLKVLQQLSGQKSVYSLGNEVQNFDQMVEMVTGIIELVSSASASEEAVVGAASQSNVSLSVPVTHSSSAGYSP